jgi:hypothetical protein
MMLIESRILNRFCASMQLHEDRLCSRQRYRAEMEVAEGKTIAWNGDGELLSAVAFIYHSPL